MGGVMIVYQKFFDTVKITFTRKRSFRREFKSLSVQEFVIKLTQSGCKLNTRL